MLRRLSFKAQEQGIHHQHNIYYVLESGGAYIVYVSLGSLQDHVELNQGVCKGKEIIYFVKIYPSEASPSWMVAMVE